VRHGRRIPLRRLGRSRASGKRVAVVGDLIADEYLYGKPARISREAPVLILRFTDREVRLGGGANAAHKCARWAPCLPVGVVGDDRPARSAALFTGPASPPTALSAGRRPR
jgi:bifunctional ADP-heptose synthase (sugar kinase/adenylyltransferase)